MCILCYANATYYNKIINTMIQSDAVTGEISLTCDAWQASNTDGYFVVTGHWIEESWPGVWEIQSALFGFTSLNNAHNGKRLGGALFKIIDRLGIAHQVCEIIYFRINTHSVLRSATSPATMHQI